jgi:acyl carrier protein
VTLTHGALGSAAEVVRALGAGATLVLAGEETGAAGDLIAILNRVEEAPDGRARILDRFLRDMPIGAVGELFLAEPGVRGYQGRAALTAERCVADYDGGRLFRTGETARRHGDGTLEILTAPDTTTSAETAFVAPATPEEELMAGIWADVLESDQIGVHDDFFALGGHSLLAIQIVARIRKTFGIRIPLTTIFDHPTVAGLLPVVEALVWDEISRMPENEVQQALASHTDDENGAR